MTTIREAVGGTYDSAMIRTWSAAAGKVPCSSRLHFPHDRRAPIVRDNTSAGHSYGLRHATRHDLEEFIFWNIATGHRCRGHWRNVRRRWLEGVLFEVKYESVGFPTYGSHAKELIVPEGTTDAQLVAACRELISYESLVGTVDDDGFWEEWEEVATAAS
jgi:hypothetical protein